MIYFFGEEEYLDVMNDGDRLQTDLAIKDAKSNDVLLTAMLDYMIHHRNQKYIELAKTIGAGRAKENGISGADHDKYIYTIDWERCVICGDPSQELYRHPKGAKIDVPFCSNCIQAIALQWLGDKLSFGIAYVYNYDSVREEPPVWED